MTLQAHYATELDEIKHRIRDRHSRAVFSDPLVDACEHAERLEASLAIALRDHRHDSAVFERLFQAWEAASDVRMLLCCDEPPSERAVHVHGRDCGQPLVCGAVGLEADEGFRLPGKPAPHPAGGWQWTAWGSVPVAVEPDDCGTAIGSMTELPADYQEEWAC